MRLDSITNAGAAFMLTLTLKIKTHKHLKMIIFSLVTCANHKTNTALIVPLCRSEKQNVFSMTI